MILEFSVVAALLTQPFVVSALTCPNDGGDDCSSALTQFKKDCTCQSFCKPTFGSQLTSLGCCESALNCLPCVGTRIYCAKDINGKDDLEHGFDDFEPTPSDPNFLGTTSANNCDEVVKQQPDCTEQFVVKCGDTYSCQGDRSTVCADDGALVICQNPNHASHSGINLGGCSASCSGPCLVYNKEEFCCINNGQIHGSTCSTRWKDGKAPPTGSGVSLVHSTFGQSAGFTAAKSLVVSFAAVVVAAVAWMV